jgi:hypothetical protein
MHQYAIVGCQCRQPIRLEAGRLYSGGTSSHKLASCNHGHLDAVCIRIGTKLLFIYLDVPFGLETAVAHHRSAFFYPHKILFEIHRVFGFFCFRILIFTDFIQSPIIVFWQRDLANPRPATDFPSPVP